jgi:LPS O-antigen subunit length determinant protein (WzzB/FepE family)
MTDQAINTDDEISLLDILVILAESWKLLLFGPLIAALLAGALSFLWPKTFESVVIVRLTEDEVALLHAAPVLDPLIEKFGYLQNADGIKDDAIVALKKDLSFSTDKKTRFSTVVAKGRTPESAQVLGQAAMEALLIELQPKGKEKEAILQEIAVNNQLIADGVISVERNSAKQKDTKFFDDLNNSDGAKTKTVNLKLINLELGLKLQAKGSEVFVQEPSLPQRKTSPKRTLVVLLAAMATIFALLLFVFIRKAWNSACQDEVASAKIKKIKLAFTRK